MPYIPPQNPHQRYVAVLNKKIEPGRLMNALGHMTIGLGNGVLRDHDLSLWDYIDADEGVHPQISYFPFIVLAAKNSNKIRDLRQQAITKGIPFTDFSQPMTVGTPEEQIQAMSQSSAEDLEYYGILLFGENDELYEITKKFSLFN